MIANHGVITFGKNIEEAILYAERLEYIAEMAFKTNLLIKNNKSSISKDLIKKHYFRKRTIKSFEEMNIFWYGHPKQVYIFEKMQYYTLIPFFQTKAVINPMVKEESSRRSSRSNAFTL